MPLATQPTDIKVSDYIARIDSASKQADAQILCDLMQEVTGEPPVIWGDHFIVGFGQYTYTRKQGKEEFCWFNTGFAARKTKITVYLTCDINQHKGLLDKLGKAKWGKGCLYINKLADVDVEVLRELVTLSKSNQWH